MNIKIPRKHFLIFPLANLRLKIQGEKNILQQIKKNYATYLQNFNNSSQTDFTLTVKQQSAFPEKLHHLKISQKNEIILIKHNDLTAYLNFNSLQGETTFYNIKYSFDSLLRIFFSIFLIKNNGFLLHSAGIKYKNKVLIFFGPSEAGKTTISSTVPKNLVLSDEIIALQKIKDKWLAFSTPFFGELKGKGFLYKGKLAALFYLCKDTKNKINLINNKQAAKFLLQNIINFSNDKTIIFNYLQLVEDLINNYQFADLHFLPDKKIWREIKKYVH